MISETVDQKIWDSDWDLKTKKSFQIEMAPVPVKVKLLKEMYHVDVDVDDNPLVFREAVEAACGVPPGKILKSSHFHKFFKIWI